MAASSLYLQQMDLLRNLYAKEPLYTRIGLVATESFLENINLFGDTFISVDIHGNQVQREYPDPINTPHPPLLQKVLTYQTYQQLAFPMMRSPDFIPPDDPFKHCVYGPRNKQPSNPSIPSPALCCLLGGPSTRGQEQLYEQFQAGWWTSKFSNQLIAQLEQHASAMERVDKIIGIGLGRLALDTSFQTPPHNIALNFLKHMLAVLVREFFMRRQSSHVQILLQDPGYCKGCANYLESNFNVSVLHDPGAFHNVDAHTFVISQAPSVPVRQIVTDVASYCGGPAGMLCDVIEDDGMAPSASADPSSPRCMAYRQQSCRYGMSCVMDDTNDKIRFRNNLELPGKVFGRVGLYLKKRVT